MPVAGLLLALLLSGLPWASAAAAPEEQNPLERARRQYAEQEYESVIALLEPVAVSPGTPAPARVDALELLGLSHLILGQTAKARSAFETLLRLDPQHDLRDPSGSPKLRRFFEGVRQSLGQAPPDTGQPALLHTPPSGLRAGAAAVFLARLPAQGQGAVAGAQVTLRWRAAGELSWRNQPMSPRGQDLRADVLLPRRDQPYTLQYLLEVHSSDGRLLASLGTAEQPRQLQVAGAAASGTRPVWKKWWFWTVVGAVVAGGVTVGVVMLATDRAPTGNLAPGVVQLP